MEYCRYGVPDHAYCDERQLAWEYRVNLSFAVTRNNEIVGICPMILDGDSVSYQGEACPQPLYDNDSDRDELLQHLRSAIDEYKVDHYAFIGTIDAKDGVGFMSRLINAFQTRVIDLQPLKEIESISRWLNVRKSYKSLINKGQKTHRIERSTDPRDVGILHALHKKSAGKETRHQRTWDLMAAWVQSGYAYLCTAWNSAGICDGAVFIYSYKGHQYYGHAATTVKDINHALLWKALSTSTADTFEMGWQGHYTNGKEADIEFFRRGFGGKDHPLTISQFNAS